MPAEESAPTPEAKPKELTKAVAKPTPAASTSKPEKTGKLDFSKAKPKAEKKVAEAPSKAKKEVKVCETDSILGGNINVAAEAYRNYKRVGSRTETQDFYYNKEGRRLLTFPYCLLIMISKAPVPKTEPKVSSMCTRSGPTLTAILQKVSLKRKSPEKSESEPETKPKASKPKASAKVCIYCHLKR